MYKLKQYTVMGNYQRIIQIIYCRKILYTKQFIFKKNDTNKTDLRKSKCSSVKSELEDNEITEGNIKQYVDIRNICTIMRYICSK